MERSEDVMVGRNEIAVGTGRTRLIMMLVALCCLFLGIAIGAIVRGIVGAGSDDNRLMINHTPLSPDSLSSAFARVAAQVEPSVVHIKVTEGRERTVYAREGTGSGVIVNEAGFILTNAHVVERADKIRVRLQNGSEYDAKVIGRDRLTDLAVIKIESREGLPVGRMGDSDKLNVGDWVLAIGSPFGLEQTVTAGIISAKDRDTGSSSTPFQQFLQTDAAINPGNSGGPLVNLAGEVVGINTQIATTTGYYNGIGFAMPSATAVDVYNQLVAHGRVRRGFLGIELDPVSPDLARLNKIPENEGVRVKRLSSDDSPAARAGIQSGDIIIGVNGTRVKNSRELIRKIAASPIGSLANVEYVRDGARHTAVVKLEERKDDENSLDIRQLPFDPRGIPDPDEEDSDKPGVKPTMGIRARTFTPDEAKRNGFEGVRGAIVTAVERGSLAATADEPVRAGDIITEVNYKQVTSLEDFRRLTQDLDTGDEVVMKVMRKGRGPMRRSLIITITMP
ncbi:MAG: trypsin-like peptidase domain-containing protein [Blastocatellia bacterium]|nr:trypsin-like peptidase domain-containing protein [Blastocatellia bacterium]